MSAYRLKVTVSVFFVLVAVVVVVVFWPASDEPMQQQPQENQAVSAAKSTLPQTIEQDEPNAHAERLYQVALQHTGDPNISPEPDYRAVIACCRKILAEHPDSPQAEQAQALLQEVPEQYLKEYEREMQLAYPRKPKIRKSRPLRRRVPRQLYRRPKIAIEENDS
jgi:hypothetical protein